MSSAAKPGPNSPSEGADAPEVNRENEDLSLGTTQGSDVQVYGRLLKYVSIYWAAFH